MEPLLAFGLLWLVFHRLRGRRRWMRSWHSGTPLPEWTPAPWAHRRRRGRGWRRAEWLPPTPALPREDAVSVLQRRWVAGEIDDEEFETGLDAVYAPRGRRKD